MRLPFHLVRHRLSQECLGPNLNLRWSTWEFDSAIALFGLFFERKSKVSTAWKILADDGVYLTVVFLSAI